LCTERAHLHGLAFDRGAHLCAFAVQSGEGGCQQEVDTEAFQEQTRYRDSRTQVKGHASQMSSARTTVRTTSRFIRCVGLRPRAPSSSFPFPPPRRRGPAEEEEVLAKGGNETSNEWDGNRGERPKWMAVFGGAGVPDETQRRGRDVGRSLIEGLQHAHSAPVALSSPDQKKPRSLMRS
jgi:hypothetical protein